MREILFRGKRVDNGEWAYGDLLTCDDEMEIYSESHGENGGWVIPETVGEYTGLTDKNGVKIFEGDVVKSRITGEKFIVIWDELYSAFVIRNSKVRYGFPKCNVKTYQVVGNIHDNPELIEEDAK